MHGSRELTSVFRTNPLESCWNLFWYIGVSGLVTCNVLDYFFLLLILLCCADFLVSLVLVEEERLVSLVTRRIVYHRSAEHLQSLCVSLLETAEFSFSCCGSMLLEMSLTSLVLTSASYFLCAFFAIYIILQTIWQCRRRQFCHVTSWMFLSYREHSKIQMAFAKLQVMCWNLLNYMYKFCCKTIFKFKSA